ncbi:hypothetical protein [Chroococcidiopsis thermalis]|uniref:Homeodomain phBC6A51-type domain-containing protein n=1 Tax=Chroococcidiopsis thermalis (strain PCC 7203) TaxID=251229 RepID=K9TWC5_CHRTP|nr:hypothetical protein [Chroococcidiopsis thermalis]AFY86703.1 hypothetical protein Chro_1176 [Chroococcidiopsis thermalis PCC 7203]
MKNLNHSGLTDRELVAVAKFVQGATPGEICEDLQIHPTTLMRWRNKPAFIEAMRKGRDFVWSMVANRLVDECLSTTAVVREMRDLPVNGFVGDTKVANVKLSASRLLLEYAARSQDIESLKNRLEVVEARLASEGEGNDYKI